MVSKDILKNSTNLPLIGTVSIGGILVVGAIFFLLGYRKKSKTITLKAV